MLITKTLQTSIDLYSANEIYTPNKSDLIMQKLRERYKLVCYQSMIITDVLRIHRISSIYLADNTLDGRAFVNVEFEVQGYVYQQGEVIHGCKIAEINTDMIIATNQFAVVNLQKEPTGRVSSILKVGQQIPIVVKTAKYTINKSSASILAIPYIPLVYKNNYYNITEGFSGEEKEKINGLYLQITEEEKRHAPFERDGRYKIFQDMLYAYSSNQKFEHSKKADDLNLKPHNFEKLLEIRSGIIVYPDEDPKSSKRFFHGEVVKLNNVYLDASIYMVANEILNKYLMYLQALRGFMETYSDLNEIKNLLEIWRGCKKLNTDAIHV